MCNKKELDFHTCRKRTTSIIVFDEEKAVQHITLHDIEADVSTKVSYSEYVLVLLGRWWSMSAYGMQMFYIFVFTCS